MIAPPSTLGNGATITVACVDNSGSSTLCSDATDTVEAVSRGFAGDAKRVFVEDFYSAPGTTP